MSGVFGIVRLDQRPVVLDDLLPLARRLAHRGPDGSHFWLSGLAGMGHLKHCITAESLHEQLPWFDAASELCITADARLDNRQELQGALDLHPSQTSMLPDSQLILAAYRKWQQDCVHHLLGDFAFAIWDSRARSLFMARDHVGGKPLYYHASDRLIVFASSGLAVTSADGVPAKVDEGRVVDYLVDELEGINNTVSFFKQVYRLPPAHYASLKQGRLVIQRYWQLNPSRELVLGNDAEYADAFEDVLSRAIRSRLRSCHPPAAMLSGGADSTTVACMALKIQQQGGFTSYSGVSDDESNCLESRYIRLAANQNGLQAVRLRPSDVPRRLAKLGEVRPCLEDPFDVSNTMLHLLYLEARENGHGVVLDGMDGDTNAGITSVYISYLIKQGDWSAALREIRDQRLQGMGGKVSLLSAHWRAIRPAFTPAFIRKLKHRLMERNWNRRAMYAGMLSRDIVHRVNLQQRWKEYMEQSTRGFCPDLRHAHAEAQAAPYVTAAIERYTRTAAYYCVEARQPFQDKRVMEFCLSLPWQQKARSGHYKYCLRRVLERHAPPEVAWRNQFDSIMWKFAELQNRLQKAANLRTVIAHRQRLLEFLDQSALDSAVALCATDDYEAQGTVAKLATLINWVDGSGAESPI